MKDDHYEFTTVAIMGAFSLLCTLGLGVLIIMENVTKDNSFGIEGIIEMLKATSAALIGGLITLTRSAPTLPSPAAPPTAVSGPTTILPVASQEKPA